jgi:hypothetical protein
MVSPSTNPPKGKKSLKTPSKLEIEDLNNFLSTLFEVENIKQPIIKKNKNISTRLRKLGENSRFFKIK